LGTQMQVAATMAGWAFGMGGGTLLAHSMAHVIGGKYGGNQNPDRVCSNGVNTILQAYIAGLNPNDPDSKFLTSVFRSSTSSILGWNTTSGRVYSVYFSTNLLNGFQCLETNIPWIAGCYTDLVHSACGEGFYKIGVEMDD
ncbi:MAG: hypothetical protein MUC65_09980, partial [Pontiellaceae bacterium]|nr:hypothetical protein [Pontiellaceae bacterium]